MLTVVAPVAPVIIEVVPAHPWVTSTTPPFNVSSIASCNPFEPVLIRNWLVWVFANTAVKVQTPEFCAQLTAVGVTVSELAPSTIRRGIRVVIGIIPMPSGTVAVAASIDTVVDVPAVVTCEEARISHLPYSEATGCPNTLIPMMSDGRGFCCA